MLVQLDAEGGALRIERAPTSAPGLVWARCYLVPPAGRPARFLGAEALDIIAGRLVANMLDLDRPTTSTIDGQPVRWVLSLAEAHHQLLVSLDGAVRVLHWRDGGGRPVAPVLRLDEAQFRRWRQQLAPLGRPRPRNA